MTTHPEEHPAPRVRRAIMAEPWAILPVTLELILEIAARRGDPEAIAVKRGARLDGARDVETRDGVAVIPVMGPIFPRAAMFESISQAAVSVETLARDFQAALDDPAIKAVVLNIDSPGGQVSGVHELAAQVFAARGVKPVVAYVQGTGASAAYWIASAASRVVAARTALLGSIGVIAAMPKGDGKTVSIVSSNAPKKRVDPESEDGRAEVLRTLDDLAGIFASDVAAYRGRAVEDVEQNFGQGGVLVGARAVAAGLADSLGTLEQVIAELSASRPLAGNLNATEDIMPDAHKPDAGGGPTAANQPPATPSQPNPEARPQADAGPAAADVLAVVAAVCGPEAAHAVTAALAEAAAMDIPPKTYAMLSAKFAARPVAPAKAETPAAPQKPAVPPAVAAIEAALAKPSAPGAVTAAPQQNTFVAMVQAKYPKGGK